MRDRPAAALIPPVCRLVASVALIAGHGRQKALAEGLQELNCPPSLGNSGIGPFHRAFGRYLRADV